MWFILYRWRLTVIMTFAVGNIIDRISVFFQAVPPYISVTWLMILKLPREAPIFTKYVIYNIM